MRISNKKGKIKKRPSKNTKAKKSIRLKKIEKNVDCIINNFSLENIDISTFWPDYKLFFNKRNNIAHGYDNDVDFDFDSSASNADKRIGEEELNIALEGALKLLCSITNAIEYSKK